MENNTKLIEIAEYCRNEFKESVTKEGKSRYSQTMFVSIGPDGDVRTSITPHILKQAVQCILIHKYSELASTNWYFWYRVQYIDENGAVRNNELPDGFKLRIGSWCSYSNQVLELYKDHTYIYGNNNPSEWEDLMPMIWSLYNKCRECDSVKEMQLLGTLAEKDRELIDSKQEIKGLELQKAILEKEVKHYEDLLDKIQDMVSNK